MPICTPFAPGRKLNQALSWATLLGERFSNYAESVSARSGMPKINRLELADFVLALPPVKEQREIAAALADVDALLSGLDALIAKKRDLKQAAMQQLLTGQTRLPGFSGEWETIERLRVISVINKGATPMTTGSAVYADGSDLTSGTVGRGNDLTESMFILQTCIHAHSRWVRGGEILSITGKVGRVVLLRSEHRSGDMNQRIAGIHVTSAGVSGGADVPFAFATDALNAWEPSRMGQAYPSDFGLNIR